MSHDIPTAKNDRRARTAVGAVSPLFVPALQDRKYDKAIAIESQPIIIDLEDAVADNDKSAARDWIERRDPIHRSRTWVRINDVQTGRTKDDVAASGATAAVILLPKCESSADIDLLARQLDAIGSEAVIAVIVETAIGLSRIKDVAAAQPSRLRRIMLGLGDLSADMQVEWNGLSALSHHARTLIAVESRAAGLLAPIDSVYPDVRNETGLRADAAAARAVGFTGKACIHPDQLLVVADAFAPTTAQIADAQAIHDAYAHSLSIGEGAIVVGNTFVDYPVAINAESVLERAGIEFTPLHREEGFRRLITP